MAFTPKVWEDSPSTDTPISAAALIDGEERVTDYADTVAALKSNLGLSGTTAAMTNALAIANPYVYYRNTDLGRLYQSNGATWNPVPPYRIASAERTSDQTGITAATLTALTGLSITETMLAVKTLVRVYVPGMQSTSGATGFFMYLYQDGVEIESIFMNVPLADTPFPSIIEHEFTPTAASHTYTVQVYLFAGTGKNNATATVRSKITIEAI